MGAESLPLFLRGRVPSRSTIAVLALLVVLVLLGYAVYLVATTLGHWPGGEPHLMAPFRWLMADTNLA